MTRTRGCGLVLAGLLLTSCSENTSSPPPGDLPRDSGPRREGGLDRGRDAAADAASADRQLVDLAKPDTTIPCGDGRPGILCGGACVLPMVDPAHCGGCGKACAGGEACIGGTCQSSCTGGTTYCNGTCVNTATDAANCGKCGTVCPATQVCSSGICACPTGTKL